MILKLNTQRVQTLQDLRDFTAGNESFDLEPVSHHEGDRLIEQTLRKFRYEQLGKAGKGSVKAYLEKQRRLAARQHKDRHEWKRLRHRMKPRPIHRRPVGTQTGE